MLSRLANSMMRMGPSTAVRSLRLQSSNSASKVKRPCGKCVRCSCHTKKVTTPPPVAAARHQSTAPALAHAHQGEFEPCDGRPEWIKDPAAPTGLDVKEVVNHDDHDKRWLEVTWSDGNRTLHPYLWLRDNCTCPDCFHPNTLSRRFLMKNLDTDIEPRNIQVDETDRRVYIRWSDGHGGVYPFSWLEGRSFTEKSRKQREKWLPREHTYWGGEMQDNIPSETFENIMADDKALYRWINTLEQTGLFRVQGAPQAEGVLRLLAQRVSFLKPTHFGDLWEVRTRLNPSNLQYTTATLGLHIDLTYYDYTPGVQLLHCIKQAKVEGGDNQFVDGFHIAERMRNEKPEMFKLLTEVLIDHYDLGEETDHRKFFKLQRQPVIRFDRDGRFDRITYNNMVRDNVLCAPVEVVNQLYEAMKAFDNMLHDPQSHIVYKMEPGDIICFHNYRVMHGRKGYRQVEPGDRHLQGGFVDWDEMYCKRRVLQMMLGLD